MRGAADVLPALPDAAYADTEVTTNVPFNVARSDAREFGVSMAFTGTASNCVQIAFGRDADCDGELSPEETAMAHCRCRNLITLPSAGQIPLKR